MNVLWKSGKSRKFSAVCGDATSRDSLRGKMLTLSPILLNIALSQIEHLVLYYYVVLIFIPLLI